ncbi:MAG: WbuC family cupin fold metalloprotein [Acidobacteria bacterium]|nr:WbuC family cupin fold metalloprotein [Acidobacteriota bacterium]
MITTFSIEQLQELAKAACEHPRGRLNLNIHSELRDPVQRFFNAMEPGSYVRPHRHGTGRWELFVALAGRAAVLIFDDCGTVTARSVISPRGPDLAVEIQDGVFHAVAALESGTLLLELKPGPYHPIEDKDFAGWAPAENSASAAPFELWYHHARVGQSAPSI